MVGLPVTLCWRKGRGRLRIVRNFMGPRPLLALQQDGLLRNTGSHLVLCSLQSWILVLDGKGPTSNGLFDQTPGFCLPIVAPNWGTWKFMDPCWLWNIKALSQTPFSCFCLFHCCFAMSLGHMQTPLRGLRPPPDNPGEGFHWCLPAPWS